MNKTIYDSHYFFKTYFENASEKVFFVDSFLERLTYIKQPRTLLDIGSHDGGLLKKIIQNDMHGYFNDMDITAVEPANVSDMFSKNIRPLVKKVLFIQKEIDNYFDTTEKKFDIIVASQSLYWSLNLPAICKEINDRSRAACIALRGNTGIYSIQSKFKELIGNKKEQLYTSNDIRLALEKNSIIYEKKSIESIIHLPPRKTEAASAMLSFFLQKDADYLNKTETKMVFDFIYDELSRDSKTIMHHVDFFWLGEFINE